MKYKYEKTSKLELINFNKLKADVTTRISLTNKQTNTNIYNINNIKWLTDGTGSTIYSD